jgi:hypothetical protein
MSERYKDMEEYLTLYDAWAYFGLYDHNANLLKSKSQSLRRLILWLGVAATVLAISYQLWLQELTQPIFSAGFLSKVTWALLTRLVIILLPITISALLTYSSKIERGSRWVLLRGAAEAIKQEIFRYRVQAGIYSPDNTQTETRDQKLANSLKCINERLMKTEINLTRLQSYLGKVPPLIEFGHKADDGYFNLTPEKFLEFRLKTQISFYRSRASKFSGQMRQLNIWIIIAGAAGTFLAAVNQEIWIAFTTALAIAFTSFLEYNQLENTVTSYNQSANDLDSIRIWWRSLSAAQKTEPEITEKLVSSTEDVLKFESLGWIQNMQDALKKLDTQSQAFMGREKISLGDAEETEEITDGAYYGPTDVPDAAISDGAYYGPTDVPDAFITDGDYYGPTDVPDAAILNGAYYGPTDVPDAAIPESEFSPEADIKLEPIDLSPDDLQELDSLLTEEENNSFSQPDFPFGGYPPDDEEIDLDDFLPGKSSTAR